MNDRHLQKPYPLRMPDDMRTKLEQAAKDGGRSLHAEILRRLEWALTMVDAPKKVEGSTPTTQPVGGELTWLVTSDIKDLAAKEGVPFDEMLAKIVLAGLHPTAPEVLYLPIFPGATTQELRAAMEASKELVRPDAAIVSEMLQRAPWAPSWMAERMAKHDAEADLVTHNEDGSVTVYQIKKSKASNPAATKTPHGFKHFHPAEDEESAHAPTKPVVQRVLRKTPAPKKTTKS